MSGDEGSNDGVLFGLGDVLGVAIDGIPERVQAWPVYLQNDC